MAGISVKHATPYVSNDHEIAAEDLETLNERVCNILCDVQPGIAPSTKRDEGPCLLLVGLDTATRGKLSELTGRTSTMAALTQLINEAVNGIDASTATEPREIEVQWEGSTEVPLHWDLTITKQSHVGEEFNPGASEPERFVASNGVTLWSAGHPEYQSEDVLLVGGLSSPTGKCTDPFNLIPNQQKKRIEIAIGEYLEHHNGDSHGEEPDTDDS